MASSPLLPQMSTTYEAPVSPSLSTKSPEALISYTIQNVGNILECSKQRRSRHEQLPHLAHFVRETYFKCQLSPTVLIVALIYLERLKTSLPVQARGDFDTPYKIFLAAIVIASKYTEDYSLQATVIRATIAPVFSAREMNEMERSFLGLIKFDLHVDLAQVERFVQQHGAQLELELGL
ncbi:hypothetical protein INT43_006398 [Umbelopsis isabellina]|uniref:Cyclin-like domain-containing protein n=1 Tax=Mortierella isabellina TaxID=91625 RepID=A0A8H7PZY2_MORIS|nr:hypothetical protein INT43_006398 [Umbelopsis isabellina]